MVNQLQLFPESGQSTGLPAHLLTYSPGFLRADAAQDLFSQLMAAAPWKQRLVRMYDREVSTPRLTAWFGDPEALAVVEKQDVTTARWMPELLNLRQQVEELTGSRFNSVLLNLYRDQQDSVAWHSDNETVMGSQPVIASLSLGQVRTFDIRRKTDHREKYSVRLESGSLLVMKGDLQLHWQHRIAKSTKPMGPRINLTFRQVISPLSA